MGKVLLLLDRPSYMLNGNLGSLLYGDVSVMHLRYENEKIMKKVGVEY